MAKKRIIYNEPKSAIYRWAGKTYDGLLEYKEGEVDVIGETEKCYIVRLKMPVRENCVGDEIMVQKKNIIFPTDCSGEWWNN